MKDHNRRSALDRAVRERQMSSPSGDHIEESCRDRTEFVLGLLDRMGWSRILQLLVLVAVPALILLLTVAGLIWAIAATDKDILASVLATAVGALGGSVVSRRKR